MAFLDSIEKAVPGKSLLNVHMLFLHCVSAFLFSWCSVSSHRIVRSLFKTKSSKELEWQSIAVTSIKYSAILPFFQQVGVKPDILIYYFSIHWISNSWSDIITDVTVFVMETHNDIDFLHILLCCCLMWSAEKIGGIILMLQYFFSSCAQAVF